MIALTELRTARGWSKSRLAREAELNQNTIFLAEAKRFTPYPSQLEKLARALDFPPDRAEELLEEVNAEQ